MEPPPRTFTESGLGSNNRGNPAAGSYDMFAILHGARLLSEVEDQRRVRRLERNVY